jgi:hypothetical protein
MYIFTMAWVGTLLSGLNFNTMLKFEKEKLNKGNFSCALPYNNV